MATTETGRFITFEGVDGCGKSTQARLCAEALSARFKQSGSARQVLLTKEPGGTDVGLAIRQILLTPRETETIAPTAELLLYMADRAQHLEALVLPALARGDVVVSDRHGDSTLAYQGYGRGLDLAMIRELHHIATQGCKPNLTFLFDAPIEALAQRITHRGEGKDRLEQEAQDFHERVRQGFLTLAQAEPERVVVLNAMGSIESLHQQVMTALKLS